MGKREVAEFADALQEWAEEGTTREQKQRQTLLKWLLSRTDSRGPKDPSKSRGSKDLKEEDRDVVNRTNIEGVKIKEAVTCAMASYKSDLSASGSVGSDFVWPKAYSSIWPKAYGYIWPKAYGY
jgi:hypothetical protein